MKEVRHARIFMGRIGYVLFLVVALPLSAQRFDTLVKNAGAPVHAGVARLVPEVTIGGADATADEFLFTTVSALLAHRDGSIWVIDDRSRKGSVRRYDAAGKFLGNVGRRGDGPGEWQQPSMLSQFRDGRVMLRDAVVGRPLTFYKSNGDYDTLWSYKTSTIWSARVDNDDVVWLRIQGGVTFRQTTAIAMIRMRASGAIIDTVFPGPPLPPPQPPSFKASNGEFSSLINVPYQQRGFGAWSPGGYDARGVNTRYAINLLLPRTLPNGTTRPWRAGDRVTSIRRNAERIPLSDAEHRDQTAYMNAEADAVGTQRIGAVPAVPRTKPIVRGITFDCDGRLWVQLHQASERFEPPVPPSVNGRPPRPVIKWREPVVYDVLEPNGTFVGRVTVPYNVRVNVQDIIQSRGDVVWGVAKDDDGVESVVRYRIAWP